MLATLVAHATCVPADTPVSEVYRLFEGLPYRFIAVTEGGELLGLVARDRLGFLLGARFGHAIHGKAAIREHVLASHLAVTEGTGLMDVFGLAMARESDVFYDDIALLDVERRLVGLIPMQTLVRLQSQLIQEQAQLAEDQSRELALKNAELFRSFNELRQSQGRYEILFENSALGVALINTRGEVSTANRRLSGLLNLDAASGAPRSLCDFLSAAERRRFLSVLAQQEADHNPAQPRQMDFTLQVPGRGARVFKFFANWLPHTGQICVLLDDITESRELERRMAKQEKSALVDALAGGIAHEINNKLSPIVGFASLLVDRTSRLPDGAELARYCTSIRDSAVESARIIKQLLQLTRPHKIETERCDLRVILREAVEFLSFHVKERNCHLVLQIPERPLWIEADAGQIKQVVLNLILNAVDAVVGRPVRKITVEACVNDGQAQVLVRDTGCGIKPDVLGRIFDPFFTTKPRERGSGLGLSVCQGIIRQHDGEITVDTTEGNGSTFKFSLRLHSAETSLLRRTEHTAGDAPPNTQQPACTPVASPAAGAPPRVLIVDDEPVIIGLIQEVLRLEMDCRIDQAGNGREAIERLSEENYSLIISDVRMPEMDGFGLLEWVKFNRPDRAAHFLFITGDAGSPELNQRVENIGVPVLRKPFNIDALLETCQRLNDPGAFSAN